MNPICKFCRRQESDGKGGIQCGAADYHYNGDYGPFKGGAACKYDSDLEDKFSPSIEGAGEVERLSDYNNRLHNQMAEMQDKIRVLENRLTSIDD